MPGTNDPAGHWMPQQVYFSPSYQKTRTELLPAANARLLVPNRSEVNCFPSPCASSPRIYPRSCRFSTLQRVSNPYEATIGGRRILGTSGQPIDDLRKYTRRPPTSSSAAEIGAAVSESTGLNDCVDWLQDMLTWRHLAPTAPDTLDTYPALSDDPFVLDVSPHVFFAGNQPNFSAKKVTIGDSEVLLVSVPSFARESTAVLVDLATLDCAPLSFRGLSDGGSMDS